jgi:hypothetical protein
MCTILGINRLGSASGIDRVKTRLVHNIHNDLFRSDIIASHGDRKATRRSILAYSLAELGRPEGFASSNDSDFHCL